jgi:hypothetical protein
VTPARVTQIKKLLDLAPENPREPRWRHPALQPRSRNDRPWPPQAPRIGDTSEARD